MSVAYRFWCLCLNSNPIKNSTKTVCLAKWDSEYDCLSSHSLFHLRFDYQCTYYERIISIQRKKNLICAAHIRHTVTLTMIYDIGYSIMKLQTNHNILWMGSKRTYMKIYLLRLQCVYGELDNVSDCVSVVCVFDFIGRM